MTRRLLIAWIAAIAASTAGLMLAGRRTAESRASTSRAAAQLTVLTRQLQELASLRSDSSSLAGHPRENAGLAARIGTALSRAGCPASSLSSVSPEAESLLPAVQGQERLRRQRATFALTALTLPQLGSFLDAWRSAEPDWTITSLEVSPAPTSGGAPGPLGGDLPLRASITLESVSAEESANSGGGR